ncbi:MAG: SpoIIE family protein phosphatase [Phycisphaerae bacterium]
MAGIEAAQRIPELTTTESTISADGSAAMPAPPVGRPADNDIADLVSLKEASLTDFLDVDTLQDIQDSLASVAQVSACIRDARGQPLTEPTVSDRFQARSAAIAAAQRDGGPDSLSQPFSAPIMVAGIRLGSISMEPNHHHRIDASRADELSTRFNIKPAHARELLELCASESALQRSAGIQFLQLLASAISRLCEQEMQLRRRIVELSTLFHISTITAEARGLAQTLDRVTQSVAQAMGAKACSLRLLDDQRDELVIKSVYNLSDAYLRKGPILVDKSGVDREALAGKVVQIVDMTTDPRIAYPEDARREGIASVLCTSLSYQGRPIGVIRVYTDTPKTFTSFEIRLLQSIANQAAAAIENARLQEEAIEKVRLQRQVQIAAEVQRRMIPGRAPSIKGFDIAALYVPCFELGGDFYDFIEFGPQALGIAVADIVGKGLPASILMASARASIRAYASDIYDLDEVISRVNKAIVADTQSGEFVTLWYGTLEFKSRRLTYSVAGHDPALLIRDGTIRELGSGGMVLGVDPNEKYGKHILDIKKGDCILIYTDGLTDAMNFNGESFGRTRLREAYLRYSDLPAEQICRQLVWETRRFVGLNSRVDDTTLVVIKAVE